MTRAFLDRRESWDALNPADRIPDDAGEVAAESPANEQAASKPAASETDDVVTLSKVEHAIVEGIEGTDEPLGDKHPAAPFAIVFGAFPLALIVVISIALACIAWWSQT